MQGPSVYPWMTLYIKGWSKLNIFITLWFGTQIKPNSMTETFSFSKTDFVGVAEAKNWPPIWCKDVFKQCPESKILFLGPKRAVLRLQSCAKST